MKNITTESSIIGNILEFIWAVGIIFGCAYLVFWKGESAWWFVLAIFLANVSVNKSKTVITD